MAEVTKTIENVDTLFSQIVVNGTVYNSENYVAPETETTTEESTEETNTEEQTDDTAEAEENEEVYAVDLNDVVHNLKDSTARNSVEDINKLIPSSASEINKLVTQDSINFISSTVSELQSDLEAEATARENADSDLQSDLEAEVTARENADTAISSSITNINSSISTINAKIPNQASAQNQLADKDFVNSSIASNTANFLGTYTSMADIEAIQNPTNNDYVFLATTDSAGNTKYDRYKYSADQDEWLFEYELNNSSFTAEQWATINSGLTQSSVNSAISTAVGALDVTSVGGSGKYISAISETDGKISATETTMDTTPTQGSTNAVTSGGVYDALESSGGNTKMDKYNPTGTGSFSLNRKADTTIGSNSFAEGYDTTASGSYSHAEGYNTTASGIDSHAEGYVTTASSIGSHAEGSNTTASGSYSHAEGSNTTASGSYSHAEGLYTTASGRYSHAEGYGIVASGSCSHAEGTGVEASSDYQHVQGKYNVIDSNDTYADIVGGGNPISGSRVNISALDWRGNLHLKGDVYVGCDDDSTNGTKLVTETSITNAINALDVSSVGGSGKYISAISETDGKISATATTMDTTPTQGSTKAVTSGGVYGALDSLDSSISTAITNAIGALDVSSVGGSGKYISAISETDGKISATATTMDTTPTQGSTKAVTSGGVYGAIPPAGSVIMFAGSSAPTGWLLCQGQAVSRTTYAKLFTAIGTTYGTGDGSTTFNLPDLREAVPVGVGTRASGVTEHDTYSLGTFKDDQFQGHEHNYQKHTGSAKANWNNSYNITNFSDTPTSAIVEKSGYGAPRYGTTTHGKQLGLNFIIKY